MAKRARKLTTTQKVEFVKKYATDAIKNDERIGAWRPLAIMADADDGVILGVRLDGDVKRKFNPIRLGSTAVMKLQYSNEHYRGGHEVNMINRLLNTPGGKRLFGELYDFAEFNLREPHIGKSLGYYVMERYDFDLDNYSIEYNPSSDEIFKFFDNVLEAVRFMHADNLVHSDIKPGNIMRRYGRWTVADFGITNSETPLTSNLWTEFEGNPQFAAYEQMDTFRKRKTNDIESIVYTIAFLLNDRKLPWDDAYGDGVKWSRLEQTPLVYDSKKRAALLDWVKKNKLDLPEHVLVRLSPNPPGGIKNVPLPAPGKKHPAIGDWIFLFRVNKSDGEDLAVVVAKRDTTAENIPLALAHIGIGYTPNVLNPIDFGECNEYKYAVTEW